MTIISGSVIRSVIREIPPDPEPPSLDALGEIEEQLSIAVDGTATTVAASFSLDVVFDVDFVDGRFQRYSNLNRPIVSFGAVIDAAGFIDISGYVDHFEVDERGVVTGATLVVGAHTGGVDDSIAFTGTADFTFQGFGSLPNEPSDADFSG